MAQNLKRSFRIDHPSENINFKQQFRSIEVQSSESLRLLLILPFAFRNKLSHGTDLHREIVELEVKPSLYLNLCHREHTGKTKGNDLPAKQI